MDIPAGQFKAKCLQIMDQVARSRQPVTITKRGKPVAKLVPAEEPDDLEPLFGYMAGTAEIRGDIVQPLDVEWSALSAEEDPLYADLQADPYGIRPQIGKRRHK